MPFFCACLARLNSSAGRRFPGSSLTPRIYRREAGAAWCRRDCFKFLAFQFLLDHGECALVRTQLTDAGEAPNRNGEESEMAVILPSGWKNFEGGGSDANFARLPQLLRRQHAPFLLCTGATRCKSTNSEVLFSPLPEL